MTEVLDVGPFDAETLTVQWMLQQYPTANTRRPGDPLPFIIVEQVAGKESVDESTSDPVVQLMILCDKKNGEDAARDIKDRAHRRMLLLGRSLEADATIDWMRVFESPRRMKYQSDNVIAYVARYQFGLTYD